MPVELTRRDEFAVLTLNRPEALNALSFAIIGEIGEALDEVKGWTDARALVVTGAGGRAFCAGADIKELLGRDLQAQKRGAQLGQRTFAKLTELPMTSVAVIDGFAFGQPDALPSCAMPRTRRTQNTTVTERVGILNDAISANYYRTHEAIRVQSFSDEKLFIVVTMDYTR